MTEGLRVILVVFTAYIPLLLETVTDTTRLASDVIHSVRVVGMVNDSLFWYFEAKAVRLALNYAD